MKRSILGLLAVAALGLCALSEATQPPDKGPPDKKGGKGDKKGPPPFEIGKVLPPFVMDQLELTEEQQKKLQDLEKDVKARLEKILTADQLEMIKEMKGPGKGPGGKGGPGGPGGKGGPGDDGPPDKKGKGGDKGPGGEQAQAGVPAGIQWYATWESGLREAQRTGRPILLVSAAPSCAGVCGIW